MPKFTTRGDCHTFSPLFFKKKVKTMEMRIIHTFSVPLSVSSFTHDSVKNCTIKGGFTVVCIKYVINVCNELQALILIIQADVSYSI